MKKSNNIPSVPSNNPEWDKLQLEELRSNVELRKLQVKEFSNKAICDKIEHARRNVEMLDRLHYNFENIENKCHDNIKKLVLVIIEENLSVLRHVQDIK